MCGIAAFSLDQGAAVPSHWLSNAQSLLGKRGPDDNGVFEDPEHGVALVHTRLAILDVTPMGHQPMFSEISVWLLSLMARSIIFLSYVPNSSLKDIYFVEI